MKKEIIKKLEELGWAKQEVVVLTKGDEVAIVTKDGNVKYSENVE